MRLLVVEDEPDLGASLVRSLREEGFAVDLAPDGIEAAALLERPDYDAVLLDLMLPRLDGWRLLEQLRRGDNPVPVLVLTARDTTADAVRLLSIGADDYVTKPFAFDELVARTRALIRRSTRQASPLIAIGDVAIDTAAQRVTRQDREVVLAAKEYALLEYLALRRGAVVSRATLHERLYDLSSEAQSNVIDVYIASLRRKLGPDVIQTRRGQGFLIERT